MGLAISASEKQSNPVRSQMVGDRAAKQYECAGYLVVREVVAGERAGQSRLHAAKFCQQRCTCPHCGARRAGKMGAAYWPRLESVKRENPGLKWYFATGTVVNGPDLGKTFAILDATAKRWRETLKKQRQRGGVLSNVLGGLMAFETKRSSRQGGWHPHVHILLAVLGRLDYSEVRAAWVTSGQGQADYLRTMMIWADYRVERGDFAEGSEQYGAQLRTDLCEVIKYPLKFEHGREHEVWDVSEVLAGRTLSRPFGCLRGVHVPESLLDEPLNWDELEWVERWYRYQTGHGYMEQFGRRPSGQDVRPQPGEVVQPLAERLAGGAGETC